ncbi:hypothetical protein JOF56_008730 [Kibdelosporangium banguiense]|uniref:Secreted protein n=1 Tax=Kibdelosporangium banguiense TaxID=1365924 RepID=A0ABS4TVA9_9PSEU|nr:hypothetical protein [Kibdelosporangium banguiense]MBP2328345.1 hypothetical protein [Kibdelosporangium banguiense]
MRNRIHRISVALAAVASCVAGMILFAGPAAAGPARTSLSAAGNSTNGKVAASFSTTLTKTSSQGGNTVTEVIYCGGYVSYPYIQDGAVRVDTHGECTAPVDNIWILSAIYLSNGSNLAERAKNFPGTDRADMFAVTGCLGMSLNYIGFGSATFTKYGYANSPLYMSGQTPVVPIFC